MKYNFLRVTSLLVGLLDQDGQQEDDDWKMLKLHGSGVVVWMIFQSIFI